MSYLEYEIDPADMQDQLRERSERIDAARDAAYEQGADEADEPEPNVTWLLARFEDAQLVTDYLDGRANALGGVK